ncbi:MAG: biotin transporter BioY [Tepidamorphaceae bacterium]|nr:biotin transporter BioY [Rhodobiaceae bacterium]MCC0049407.1 biotin transporter BioY [Rhodobiaceae bacterium]
MSTSTAPTLATRLLGNREGTAAITQNVLLAIVGVAALWLSAKIKVPFYPVDMTMQGLVVLLIGASYGWRLAGATVALYLAQGAMGMPVFTGTPEKGIGIAYMMGPTGGYLLGFLIMAMMTGWFVERFGTRNVFAVGAVMLAGDAVMFALGIVWLGILFGWDKPILEWGLYPFILGDLTKVALAAAMTAGIGRFAKQA